MQRKYFILHAMTGCDTTSCLYNKGKKSLFQYLEKNHDETLRDAIRYFYRGNVKKNSFMKMALNAFYIYIKLQKNAKHQ